MININMKSACGTASGHSLNYILIFLPRSLVYRIFILFLCVKLSYLCHCCADSQKNQSSFSGCLISILDYWSTMHCFFLKYWKTVVGLPELAARGPPSCSTTAPPQQEQGEEIRWSSTWAEIGRATVFINYR